MSRVFRAQTRGPRAVIVAGSGAGAPAESSIQDFLAEVEARARTLLEQARRQADSIIDDARKEAAAIARKAFEQGRNEGYKQGYSEGLKEAEDLIREAQSAVELARQRLDAALDEVEPKLVALALEVARKIVSDGLCANPELTLAMVRAAIIALRDEKEFSIAVNPSLVEIIEGAKTQLAHDYGARYIEVIPDESVADGAIVRTPHGFVDATLKTQIENIARAIAEARRKVLDRGDEPEAV